MQHIKLTNIKLNQIQIFMTVADCGSFSGAAEVLNMSQPMVSKTVQNLEQELGIILFTRSHGRPLLTPAGKDCYEEWLKIMKQFEESVEKAHATQEGKHRHLKIGIGSFGTHNQRLYNVLTKVKEERGIALNLEYQVMSTLLPSLLSDEYDAVCLSGHMQRQMAGKGLESKLIYQSHLAVFMSKKNPLAKKRTLHFADLKSESFIALSAETDPQYLELLNLMSAKEGFTPRIACYIPNELSFKINLLLNNGIAMIDDAIDLEDTEIKMFSLPEYRNDLLLVWKKSNPNNSLKELVSLL